MPLDTSSTICFGDDPDEIVTIIEQACTVKSRFATVAAQCGAAALAPLAKASPADGATPTAGAVAFARAT